MRVVLDRNVLVSAAVAPAGTCAQLLDLARSGRLEVLLSPRLMDDVTTTLIGRMSAADAGRFVWRLRGAGTLVPDPHPSWPAGQLDPGSAHVVALARERGATAVVTGHGGLLRTPVRGVRILTPGAMLGRVTTERPLAEALDRARALRRGGAPSERSPERAGAERRRDQGPERSIGLTR